MGLQSDNTNDVRQILGIRFFGGDVGTAVERMAQGGLLVVPAAPALKDIASSRAYREALTNADVAITDSAFMILLWNLLEHDHLKRVSGLKYLRELLSRPDVREPGNTMWIMAGEASAQTNADWLASQGISVSPECVYVAPMYGSRIEDPALVEHLQKHPVRHIVVTLGGGTQERLGLYLKRALDYTPAIHCIGAAIAFLSGDQVKIPNWADRFYLGWLFRCMSSPSRYVPRYWSAFLLFPMLWRYREKLPPMQPEGPHGVGARA